MTTETRLAEIQALAEKLDGGLPCAWCDIPAVGLARHNDGLLNPSCGEDGHGFGWRAAGSPRTIAGALTSYPTMATAITDVLDLHKPVEDYTGRPVCDECWGQTDYGEAVAVAHPCATARALTAALGVEG